MVQAETIVTRAMISQFYETDEPVIFKASVDIMTRLGRIKRGRSLIITGMRIYFFNQDNLQLRYDIVNLKGIVKSSLSNEVVLVFSKEKDVRFEGLQSN